MKTVLCERNNNFDFIKGPFSSTAVSCAATRPWILWRFESFIAGHFCSRLSVGFDRDSDVRRPQDSHPDPQPSSCLLFRITEVSDVSLPVPMSLRSLQRDWLAASLDVPPGFTQYAHFLNFYCRLYNLLCTKRNGHPLCKRHSRTNSTTKETHSFMWRHKQLASRFTFFKL